MYFPKNLLSIKAAQAFKDFCLNPKGIKVFSSHASLKNLKFIIKRSNRLQTSKKRGKLNLL